MMSTTGGSSENVAISFISKVFQYVIYYSNCSLTFIFSLSSVVTLCRVIIDSSTGN